MATRGGLSASDDHQGKHAMFVQELRDRLDEQSLPVLGNAGIGNFEELYALLLQFPSIGRDPAVSLPHLSYLASSALSTAVMNSIQHSAGMSVSFATGSVPPPHSLIGNGYMESAPTGPVPSVGVRPVPISQPIATPVRDQGMRGTCVAHAVVACAEVYFGHGDLSEQFLYWAAKTHGEDPFPNDRGTWLRCARNALVAHGVCDETLWGYNPQEVTGNEPQGVVGSEPSAQAIADASTRATAAGACEDTSAALSGKAARLAQEVAIGPVAVAMPVFEDQMSRVMNWTWTGARDYGHVLDPTPFSVVKGGHAVCVNAYEPSSAAPGGGWFVFKNSWGTALWSSGAKSPPVGHPNPPPGFGYLSAAYVDRFLWEALRL
ncbi:MAG TPA: C1 family peptidase [Isosphaeraceae bacterium]|nr:C1 family peptidase [Isosphaeraceae bacterium]